MTSELYGTAFGHFLWGNLMVTSLGLCVKSPLYTVHTSYCISLTHYNCMYIYIALINDPLIRWVAGPTSSLVCIFLCLSLMIATGVNQSPRGLPLQDGRCTWSISFIICYYLFIIYYFVAFAVKLDTRMGVCSGRLFGHHEFTVSKFIKWR